MASEYQNFHLPTSANKSYSGARQNYKSSVNQLLPNKMKLLIENGRLIYNDILGQLINTSDWNNLTEDQKQTILNFSNEQFAQLAVVFSTDSTFDLNIRSCISSALGLAGIKTIINTGSLLTASTAIEILTVVGKRYLAWVGVAFMIWDFVDCIRDKTLPSLIPVKQNIPKKNLSINHP